jgi:hypothetical protein
VDDAMADRLRRDEAVDGLRVLSVDQMELEAGRAGVDGEDRQNWFQSGASSSRCDGRCEARTQGASV